MTCFKAYDIRGRYGTDLTDEIARRIGLAFVQVMGARQVVIGRDARLHSPQLAKALSDGLMAAGAEVLDLGLCGTEEVYFAAAHTGAGGGIMVTASHNPAGDNGMKLVGPDAAPIDPEAHLGAIRALVEGGVLAGKGGGCVRGMPDLRAAYVDKVLTVADPGTADLHILVNSGNGAAGPTFDALAAGLAARGSGLRFTRLHHDPDGRFPNGVPNPMLAQNQPVTSRAVRDAGADFGVAWDGDFDRCFLFDGEGNFVPGEYVVALLAEAFLLREPGAVIVHDPRVIWNTQAVVRRMGGRAVMAPTGHVFLKKAMRDTGAVYGGEMSAHHYFRDFMACDSGMIPWLLVAGLIGQRGRTLAEMVAGYRAAFPSSGEINFTVSDPRAIVSAIETELSAGALERDLTDGLSLSFADWRMNLRASNTEALLRLNIETRADPGLLRSAVGRISALIAERDGAARRS